jgi:hypothetical protein
MTKADSKKKETSLIIKRKKIINHQFIFTE